MAVAVAGMTVAVAGVRYHLIPVEGLKPGWPWPWPGWPWL